MPSQIRRYREAQHIELRKLSQTTGIPLAELAEMEEGDLLPRPGQLRRLVKALGVLECELFPGMRKAAPTINKPEMPAPVRFVTTPIAGRPPGRNVQRRMRLAQALQEQ